MVSIKKTATKVLLVTLCSCLVIDLTQGLPNHIGLRGSGTQARVQTGVGINDVGEKCKGVVSQVNDGTSGSLSGIGKYVDPLKGIGSGVSGTLDGSPIQVGGLTGKNGGISKTVGVVGELPGAVGGLGNSCGQADKELGKSVIGISDEGLQLGNQAQGSAGELVSSADDSSNTLGNEVSGFAGNFGKTCKGSVGGIVPSVGGLTGGLFGGNRGISGLFGNLLGSEGGKGGLGLNPGNLIGKKLEIAEGLTGGLLDGGSPSAGCNAGISGGKVCGKVNPDGQRCY